MTVRETYEALRTQLLTTNLPVHASAVVTAEDTLVRGTYIILWPAVGADRDERYAKAPDVAGPVGFDVDVRVVGHTESAALQAIDRVRDAVVGHRLVVPGRSCTPIRVEAGRVELDRSVKPGLWFCDLGLLFVSRRGS